MIYKRDKLRGWTPSQLRFHLKRAGSITAWCDFMDVNKNVLYRVYKPIEADHLHNGRMVNIGGFLVKRCSECEVTRSINDFYADEKQQSGVRARCKICIISERDV